MSEPGAEPHPTAPIRPGLLAWRTARQHPGEQELDGFGEMGRRQAVSAAIYGRGRLIIVCWHEPHAVGWIWDELILGSRPDVAAGAAGRFTAAPASIWRGAC